MKISDLVQFHDERFFEGAVQLRWVQERETQAEQAAQAFVFHGPRYHGANDAAKDGIETSYRLKDSASLVRDLLKSIHRGWRGEEQNPYSLVVAGYGSGKSHLALTCAILLGQPHHRVAQQIIAHISQADSAIGQEVQQFIAGFAKPALVLALDGMAGFHLGNALIQAVFTQLRRYHVDAGAIRDLSPRFQTAEQFVERNFAIRADQFNQYLPHWTIAAICTALQNNDEAVYAEVDAIYNQANGSPIPVTGLESAQELINTLCDVYCGANGAFSSVVILFDELGRYLEYAAEKPQLAGDAALQQIFQGVQDNSNKVRLIGFIQYELKAYLKRFSTADLRQLQRYITRFDAAEKWYLSTNLETLFAHLIGKNETGLAQLRKETNADNYELLTWRRMQHALPRFQQFPVWNEPERFSRVITQGCWPLHPLATWFLTQQRDVVQSRSALTFIKDLIERIGAEEAIVPGKRLRQVSAAELTLRSLLPEMIAAERETGATVAETLQLLLEKFQAHLNDPQRLALAGVAILQKMRVGKQNQQGMNELLSEATALDNEALNAALQVLNRELGALEWNADLGQYELIADASTRGQFQQWLRKRLTEFTADAVRDLFVKRATQDGELGHIDTDFGQSNNIGTLDWRFEAQFAHSGTVDGLIYRAFQQWQQAFSPKDAKGQLIYLYLHPDDDANAVDIKICAKLQQELQKTGYAAAPIWIVGIPDHQGKIAEHLARLQLFEDPLSAKDQEQFRRFIPEDSVRSRQALKETIQELIKERWHRIAGFADVPAGRLRQIGTAIFARIYPQALPFPFDGFATTAGAGMSDCTQITRDLIMGQVDGPWMLAQKIRIKNRVSTLLARSWQTLRPSGHLTEPDDPAVKAVYQQLYERHQNQPQTTLWDSCRLLIDPPYGMNAASAGLMLGLLIGIHHPPRRLALDGEMIGSAEWINAAFPNQRSQFLTKEILEQSTLRFLAENSEQRWRSLLNRWENETHYLQKVELAHEAARLRKIDPLPESLEGSYSYLRDKANDVLILLREMRTRLDQWERQIESAERQDDLGWILKIGSLLFQQHKEFRNKACWPDEYAQDCQKLLTEVQQFLAPRLSDWIPRQSCNHIAQIIEFKTRMEKAVKRCRELGFESEAKVLDRHAQEVGFQVEERQRFVLTLDESNNYPLQPDPTESTPVRELRDDLAKGDMLIKGVRAASHVLKSAEIKARIDAIEQRKQKLNAMLKRQRDNLGNLYETAPTTLQSLRGAIAAVQRLQPVFTGAVDERELTELAIQLEHILAAVSAWTTGDVVSVERLMDLLQQQLEQQLVALNALLAEEEMEPAWDIRGVFQALANERIAAAYRRSVHWLAPYQALPKPIDQMDQRDCQALEQELQTAPGYLADADRAQVDRLLNVVRQRFLALAEQARQAQMAAWQQPFLVLENVDDLSRYETEQLLKVLQQPPYELRLVEQTGLEPVRMKLTAHLDQISMNELIQRIFQLSLDRQQQLLNLLLEQLKA